jgi:hypothetical protein
MKRPMKRRSLRAALGLTALTTAASCTTQPVLLPSRDFDRPSDITFVCVGALDASAAGPAGADAGTPAGTLTVTGRPMRECHPRGKVDPAPALDHRTFAFVPNSSSGDLTVLDADRWSLINLDPANPNYNRLPIGVLPSQVVSSDDGCRLVTANHGSCDLSFVDPAALLTPTLASQTPGQTLAAPAGSPIVTEVVPRTQSGRALHLFAGEVSFVPQDISTTAPICGLEPAKQWQAVVTFPSCDLVAVMDLPSGVIRSAAYARKTGNGVALVPLAAGEEPVCPVSDCLYDPVDTDGGVDASPADGGTDASPSDGGTDASPADGTVASVDAEDPSTLPGGPPYVGPGALRPSALAVSPRTGRAYVGLANAAFVLSFDVAGGKLGTLNSHAIPLHEGALGVNRLRLSIDPYKETTGTPGDFIVDDPAVADRQYLYVIARDGSLRVVHAQSEIECETNKDFSGTADKDARQRDMNKACWPVVGPSARRPGVVGPGIRTPTPPIDVAVADVRPIMPDNSETSVAGAHAWILTANGATFLANLDPVPRDINWVDFSPAAPDPRTQLVPVNAAAVLSCNTTNPAGPCLQEPAPAPNTLRNRSFLGYTPSLDPSVGPPRLDVAASQPATGPRIETLWTLGSAANALAQTGDFIETQVYFPDPASAVPQTWTVTWEGYLMASPRYSGQITASSSLRDLGADFCRLNVQNDDLVTLQGCTDTNQCGIGKECVFGSNGAVATGGAAITGLCLAPENQTSCDALLSTIRRYDVTSTTQRELGLAPHKDELVRRAGMPCSPRPMVGDGGVDGSADARDGAADAGAADAAGSETGSTDGGTAASTSPFVSSDCVDPNDATTAKFQCVAGRCLYPCSKPGDTASCRAGRICVAFPSGNFCADAPPFDDTARNKCVGELIPYQVAVGRGYLVAGSQTALPATRMADPSGNGMCVPIPGLDERANIRIPVDAEVCANIATTPEAQSLDSRCDPNLSNPGCGSVTQAAAQVTAASLQSILTTKNQPPTCVFIGGPNETDPFGTSPHHLRALFRNREVEFMMTNLERPPSGGAQIRFDVHGGFQPQLVAIPSTVEVTMPARIMLGPFDSNLASNPAGTPTTEAPYLFVVDQRRLGRSQGGGPTRGQLLRIHPRGYAITAPVPGYQPWFEDLNHSANLFPIQ